MSAVYSHKSSVTAFAPATCANVAVGFDILGFAIELVGDFVTLTRRKDKRIVIEDIDSPQLIPFDCDKNIVSFIIKKICQNLNFNIGISIHIKKGIPLSSGMGGSAACAIAAVLACNELLNLELSHQELLAYALLGEELVSGHPHADNIVPCFFGGLTLIREMNPMDIVRLPIPDLYTVIVHPHLQFETKLARKILQDQVPLTKHVKQSANLASFIAALYQRNQTLLQNSLKDVLIEPQRAHYIPGFYQIKNLALQEGALAVSLSGSGPSLFALSKSQEIAQRVAEKMCEGFKSEKITADFWISRISKNGAYIT